MPKLFLFWGVTFCSMLFCGLAAAQTYILNKTFTAGQIISTCSGTFYGSGDSTLGYGINENYTITFTPSTPGLKLQLKFDFLGIDYINGDTLFVYDGSSTSNSITNYVISGNLSLGTGFAMSTIYASDTNSTGSLTFRFVSDGFDDGGRGWKVHIQWCLPAASLYWAISPCSPSPLAAPRAVSCSLLQPVTLTITNVITSLIQVPISTGILVMVKIPCRKALRRCSILTRSMVVTKHT